MNKNLKKTIRFLKKNRELVLKTIIPVVIFCATVITIGIAIPKPNDNISPSSNGYLFENRNPKFNVGFGSKDDPQKQYVRFEANLADNPFEENEESFWNSFTKSFKSKKGFEFGLSEIRFSETESNTGKELVEQLGTAIEQMELDSISTNTEVIEVGRVLGEEDSDNVSKKTVINKDVYPGIDVEYQILEGLGVKEEIVIRNIDEYTSQCGADTECLLPLNEFVFDLKLDEGVELKESMVSLRGKTENKYYLTDDEGNYIAHFLPTFAVDGVGAKTTDVDLDITQVEGNNYKVIVMLNLDWLFSNDRVFPIRIDPSIVHDTTTEFDTGSNYNTEVVTGPKVQLKSPPIVDEMDSDVVGYWDFDAEKKTSFAFETGTITLTETIDYTTPYDVTFTHDYIDPVVVAFIPTRGGGQSVDVRVMHVSKTGCSFFMEEYDNEGHADESVSYMVVESGRWELSGGIVIEAGTHVTDSVHISSNAFSGDTVSFTESFSSTPAVLATLNTYNNSAFMSTVVHSTNTAGFSVQQEAGTTGITAETETIGWIAMNTGSGTINGYAYEAAITTLNGVNNGVTDTATTISFTSTFSSAPDVIVNGRTGNGQNGYWARGAGTYSASTLTVYAEEDEGNAEQAHAEEAWSYVAFASGANMSSSSYTDLSDGILFEDLSGNNNDAYTQLDLNALESPLGVGREFNGTDDFLEIDSAQLLTVHNSAEVTYEVWYYYQGTAFTILHRGSSGGGSEWGGCRYEPLMSSSATMLSGCGATGQIASYTSEYGWNHLAVVLSDISDIARVYLNGNIVKDTTITAIETASNQAAKIFTVPSYGTRLLIGGIYEGDVPMYNAQGAVDELRISDVPRTEDEIVRMYSIGLEERIQGAHTSASLDMQESSDIESITWTSVGDDTGDGETPYSTTDLVGQWDFNETSGTTATNEGSCGSSCDGILTNMTTTGQDVAVGSGWTSDNRRWGSGALMFDGTNDYVTAGTNTALNINNSPLTLETWIKTSYSPTNPDAIIQRMENALGASGYSLEINDDGTISSYYYYSGSGPAITSNTAVNDGQWHHIVASYGASDYAIYIDGKLDAQGSGGYPTSGSAVALNLTIGKFSEASDGYFKGIVDTARVYSRALTYTEVLSNYQSGNIEMRYRTSSDGSTWSDWSGTETAIDSFDDDYLYDTSLTGFLSYWPMEESSGTIVEDVGYTNEGTASGAYITDGKFGNGRTFDGVDDYISIPDNSSLQLSSGLTLEMWYKSTELPVDWIIPVRKDTETGTRYLYGFGLDNTSGGRIYGQYYNGTNFISTYSGPEVLDGNWHYAVMTISGTTLSFYFDGVFKESVTITDTQGVPTGELNIGATPPWTGGGRGHYFEGSIDEVRVSNTVATSLEIFDRWREGSISPSVLRTRPTSDNVEGTSSLKIDSVGSTIDANTVAYWKLDEQTGTGAYLLDSSAHSNHATPTGAIFLQDGKINGAREFDGTDDYIALSSLTGLSTGDVPHSIEMWIKPDTDAGTTRQWPVLLGTASTGNHHWTYEGGNLLMGAWGGDQCYVKPVIGEWNYVVAAYDGDNIHCYHNGQLVNSDSTTITLSSTALSLAQVKNLEAYFDGSMDEVRISNVARSAEQVAKSYDMGKGQYINQDLSSSYDISSDTKLPIWIASNQLGENLELSYGENEYANYQSDEDTVGLWHMNDSQKNVLYDSFNVRDTTNFYHWSRIDGSTPTNSHAWNSTNGYLEIRTGDNDEEKLLFYNSDLEESGYMRVNFTKVGDYPVDNMDSIQVYQDSSNYYSFQWTGSGYAYQGISKFIAGSATDSSLETGTVDSNTDYTVEVYWSPARLSLFINGTIRKNIVTTNTTALRPTLIELRVYQTDINLKDITVRSGSVQDSSGYLNDAVAVGTTQVDGIIGKAQRFDGTYGHRVAANDDTEFESQVFTIDAFIKKEGSCNYNYCVIAAKGSSGNEGFSFGVISQTTDPVLHIRINDGGSGGTQVLTGNSEIVDDVWYHVAAVVDTANDTAKLYVDGKLDASTSSFTEAINYTDASLTIGNGNYDYDIPFNGFIDEVRISDTARTVDEIRGAAKILERTHPVKVYFKAELLSSNLITGSTDTSFSIDERNFGVSNYVENIDISEKIVIRELIRGTEYIAQADVVTLNTGTGAVTVSSWDTGSGFPTGGFTVNAEVFKWQREYIDIRYPLDEDINAITRLTYRKTTDVPTLLWIDDAKKATYSSDYTASSFTPIDGVRYVQYQPIFTKWDSNPNLDLYLTEVGITYTTGPTNEQLMRHGKWFDSSGVEQPFWWVGNESPQKKYYTLTLSNATSTCGFPSLPGVTSSTVVEGGNASPELSCSGSGTFCGFIITSGACAGTFNGTTGSCSEVWQDITIEGGYYPSACPW